MPRVPLLAGGASEQTVRQYAEKRFSGNRFCHGIPVEFDGESLAVYLTRASYLARLSAWRTLLVSRIYSRVVQSPKH